MKTSILLFYLLLATWSLNAQGLAGEYFIDGQGGRIVLHLQNAGNDQLQGTLTDMQGVVYQAQATVEDGKAFGTLVNQQGGMFFEAIREGLELYLTLIPADAAGQPDPAMSQAFVMTAGGGNGEGGLPQMQAPGQGLGGPLGGASATEDNGWNDTFSGNIMGTPTTMNIQVNGGQLQGNIDAAGYRYTLNGTVSGNQSQGQFNDPQTQGAMNYTAVLNGNQINLTLRNPVNGQSQQFSFTRGTAAAGPAPGGNMNAPSPDSGQPYERDPRIVGSWSYTDSYTSGEYGFAAQWKMIVNPDGTYLYGDGRVVGGGPGISGDSGGGGDVTRGQWGTKGGIIYTNEGYGWQPYCRYTTDGASLLMQFGDGSKQLWKRTN